MSEKLRWICVISLVFVVCLVAGVSFGQTKASCPKKASSDPQFTENAIALCAKNWTDEHNKVKFLEGIDTNGVTCSAVVDHMNAKFAQELRTYELNARMLETKYSALKDVAVKYFQMTNDSTVIPLIRD